MGHCLQTLAYSPWPMLTSQQGEAEMSHSVLYKQVGSWPGALIGNLPITELISGSQCPQEWNANSYLGQRRLSKMPSHLSEPSPHTPLCPLLPSHIRTFTTPRVHMCFSSLSLCSCISLCLDLSALFPFSPPRKTPLTLQKKKQS